MKGHKLRYIIATLALLLLGSGVYAQTPDEPDLKAQFAALQTDSEEIPGQFQSLVNRLNLKDWNPTCTLDGKVVAEKNFKSFAASLKEATYLAGTMRANQRVPLPEVAEVTYVFSVGVAINMVLYKAAGCTGQQDVADDFMAMALRLVDAADNAHKVEMHLIQNEEDAIQDIDKHLKQWQKELKKPPTVPPAVFRASI